LFGSCGRRKPLVSVSTGYIDAVESYVFDCCCHYCAAKVEKEERCAMMEADRAVNLLEHQKEIHARPARQWIVSQQRKVGSAARGASKSAFTWRELCYSLVLSFYRFPPGKRMYNFEAGVSRSLSRGTICMENFIAMLGSSREAEPVLPLRPCTPLIFLPRSPPPNNRVRSTAVSIYPDRARRGVEGGGGGPGSQGGGKDNHPRSSRERGQGQRRPGGG